VDLSKLTVAILRAHHDARPDGHSVSSGSFQFDTQPTRRYSLVSHEARDRVEIHDHHIEISILIEIAQSCSSTHYGDAKTGSRQYRYIAKETMIVAEELIVSAIGRADPCLIDLWIYVSIGYEKIQIHVVVKISKPCPPPEGGKRPATEVTGKGCL